MKRPPLALIASTAVALGAVGGMLLGRYGTPERMSRTVTGAPVAKQQIDERRLLVLSTTPVGATVELDGEKLAEPTPTAIRAIAPGPHTVRLSAPGRSVVERKVTLDPDARVVLDVNLPAPQRNVLVRSVPDGAMVYLDNQLVGPSPATVVVEEGEFHELRLEKLGFANVVRAIKPDSQEAELTVSMELDPNPHSELVIDSPVEAEIWIDGVDTALETPAMGVRVTPGRHTVELRDSSGTRSKPTTIDVRAGETVRVMMNLSSRRN